MGYQTVPLENGILRTRSWPRVSTAFVLLLLLALGAGCTRLTPPINPGDTPDPAFAYFFGHLELEDKSGFYLGNSEIGLRLKYLETKKKITMRYQKEGALSVVKVKPGRYELSSVVFLDNFNTVFGERVLQAEGKPWTFVARPGRVYYIGDSLGFVGWAGGHRKQYMWRVYSFENHFPETARRFRKEYDQFKVWPVENALVKKGRPKILPVLVADL